VTYYQHWANVPIVMSYVIRRWLYLIPTYVVQQETQDVAYSRALR